MKRILIISDGKPGHLNQSIAFCKIKDVSYDILEVKFKSKFHKALSYFFDKLGYYTDFLFEDYKKFIVTNCNLIEKLLYFIDSRTIKIRRKFK